MSGKRDGAAHAKRAMGELEAAVMNVLWDRGGWSTPGEVQRVLAEEGPLAYTTAMTILVRLADKGRLERIRDGRAFAYRPLQTREEYAASRMADLLVDAGDRPAALGHFLRELPASDRDQLRRLLRSANEVT